MTPVEFVTARLMGNPVIPRYIVMTASCHMPASVKAPYGKVAVVETDRIHKPQQINSHHRSVVRVVRLWTRLFKGKTPECAFRVALAEAEALAERLNAGDTQ